VKIIDIFVKAMKNVTEFADRGNGRRIVEQAGRNKKGSAFLRSLNKLRTDHR